MINLSNIELFKDLTSLEDKNEVFDLHNDYECVGLHYEKDEQSLKVLFELRDSSKRANRLCLIFKSIVIDKFSFFLKSTDDKSILNNFYRGRFETGAGLFEYSESGEGYYYIEFEEGDVINVFSKEVLLLEI